MIYEAYITKDFRAESMATIHKARDIIAEYDDQGFVLTLRQLYYQFVARDLIPNTERSYKNLGSLINDARLAGLIAWDAIEDRTRGVQVIPTWDSPGDIVQSCAYQYRCDPWDGQPYRCEVWIEKEALAGVAESVCREFRVPLLSCRGYLSQSEAWRAGRRIARKAFEATAAEEGVKIFHLGDHDPSGIDMTRDNTDRLAMFAPDQFELIRLALNYDQVQHYGPPPNPAKITDSRAEGYIAQYGRESWELDALEPKVIQDLIRDAIDELIDRDLWDDAMRNEESDRNRLQDIADEMRAA